MQLSLVKHAEVQALRRALGNVAALSSLPSMWLNADERQIAESLADALLRVLDLDGVRVELSPDSGEAIEAERSSRKEQLPLRDALKRAFPDGQPLGGPRDFRAANCARFAWGLESKAGVGSMPSPGAPISRRKANIWLWLWLPTRQPSPGKGRARSGLCARKQRSSTPRGTKSPR